jgi:AcrR family transcriptional regulator
MVTKSSLADRILDNALEQAENSSWESVRLHSVAKSLGISLLEIKNLYPQKDALVEAWFDRADDAMLAEKTSTDFTVLAAHERVHRLIMSWLLAMKAHRRITRQMLCYKLEFGHIHLQVLGIMRISRTVQWLREAAMLDAKGILRINEEVYLTGVYLTSFARWLFDDSKGSLRTARYLRTALKRLY